MITKQELQRRVDAFLVERINNPILVCPWESSGLHPRTRLEIADRIGVEEWRISMPTVGRLVVDERGLPDERHTETAGFEWEIEIGEPEANRRAAAADAEMGRVMREGRPAAGPWIHVTQGMPTEPAIYLVQAEHIPHVWLSTWTPDFGWGIDNVRSWAKINGPQWVPAKETSE